MNVVLSVSAICSILIYCVVVVVCLAGCVGRRKAVVSETTESSESVQAGSTSNNDRNATPLNQSASDFDCCVEKSRDDDETREYSVATLPPPPKTTTEDTEAGYGSVALPNSDYGQLSFQNSVRDESGYGR